MSENALRNNFFLVSGEGNGTKLLWLATDVLFLKINTRSSRTPANFVFVQFMKCTDPLKELDREVGFRSGRWSTDVGVDYTIEAPAESNTAERHRMEKWFAVEPSNLIEQTVSVVCSNSGAEPTTRGFHWTHQ